MKRADLAKPDSDSDLISMARKLIGKTLKDRYSAQWSYEFVISSKDRKGNPLKSICGTVASKAGDFIRSRRDVVEIQSGTLAVDVSVRLEHEGREVDATA